MEITKLRHLLATEPKYIFTRCIEDFHMDEVDGGEKCYTEGNVYTFIKDERGYHGLDDMGSVYHYMILHEPNLTDDDLTYIFTKHFEVI